MSIDSGTYELGPENAMLPCAPGAPPSCSAPIRRSRRSSSPPTPVQPLDAGARARIDQTINDEVLKGTAIAFRSREVSQAHDGGLFVSGALELAGATHPISFDLQIGDDGQVSGSAVVKQNEWGMKPYTALFGTLKVADEVHVSIDGRLAVRQ